MALSLFKISKGLKIQDATGASSTDWLFGAGVPGLSVDTNNAPVGSVYLDDTTTGIFQKILSGTGTDKWAQLATQSFVDSKVTNVSWREPAKVFDATVYADITAAQTAANVGNTVDGISIVAGDRLLFPNLTAGNDNVYIVSGAAGAWTFTEDTNLATSGDSIFIDQGTEAGKVFNFNGTAWVQINASSSTEAGFIRTFIGKTSAGAALPVYTSINSIASGDSLSTAIGKLDNIIGASVTGSNFIAVQDINLNLNALDAELGANVTSGNVILSTNSINANIQALDTAINSALPASSSTNVTLVTTIDSVNADTVKLAKWIVEVENVALPANKEALEVLAMHDGTPTADASNVDFTQYAVLRLGTPITGLLVSVALSGIGAAQTMNLTVTSTVAVNVNAKRISI